MSLLTGARLVARPVVRVGLAMALVLGAAGCGQDEAAPPEVELDGPVVGFRGGPDRQGVVDVAIGGVPEEVWAVATGDHVISSPVAVGEDVVAVGDDGLLRRIGSAGTVAWEFDLGAAEATPVVVGDAVAAIASSGRLVLVSLSAGALVWEVDLGAGGRSSPTVVDGAVVVGVDQALVGLDADTGVERWRAPLDAPTGSSPAVPADDDTAGTVVVGTGDNEVVGVALPSGERSWAIDLGPKPAGLFTVASGVVSAPAISDGVAYVGSTTGRVVALEVASGEVVWDVDLGAPVYASAALGDGVVHLTTALGSAVTLDRDSGEVRWEAPLGQPSYASPLLTADTLVVTTEEGLVFGLDPADGAELWRLPIGLDGDFMASTPTITDSGTVVVGSNDGRIVGIAAP